VSVYGTDSKVWILHFDICSVISYFACNIHITDVSVLSGIMAGGFLVNSV
jgi:hypothetical protein